MSISTLKAVSAVEDLNLKFSFRYTTSLGFNIYWPLLRTCFKWKNMAEFSNELSMFETWKEHK